MANLALSSCALFGVLFVIGYFLAYILMRRKQITFIGSKLHTKTILWVPIFAIFVCFATGPRWIQYLIVLYVLIAMYLEAKKRVRYTRHTWLVVGYASLVAVSLLTSLYVASTTITFVFVIAFGSVLSDVFAFFFGNFFGKHHLPQQLNAGKTYEGIIGQVVGGILGVAATNAFVLNEPISILWFMPISAGAIVGDLLNSLVKRKEGIKDWSNYLPGHGGYLDRFASLSFSFALTALILALL